MFNDSDNNKDSEQSVSSKSEVEGNLLPTLEAEEKMNLDKPPDVESSSKEPEVFQSDPYQSNQPYQIKLEKVGMDEPPERDLSAIIIREQSAVNPEQTEINIEQLEEDAEQSEVNAGQSGINVQQTEVNAERSTECTSDELKTNESSIDANDEEKSTENTTKICVNKNGILSYETTQSGDESTEKEDKNGKTVESTDKPVENEKELSTIVNGDHDNFFGEKESSVFVCLNAEKNNRYKSTKNNQLQVTVDDQDYNSQEQEDSIGSAVEPNIVKAADEGSKDVNNVEQGADEELYIVGDTKIVISQEEKDAAIAMARIRDAMETHQSSGAIITTNVIPCLVEDVLTREVKYTFSTCTIESINTCVQCCLPRNSKYSAIKDNRSIYICDDNCMKAFKTANGDKVVINSKGDLRVKCFSFEADTDYMIATINFVRKCADCYKKIEGTEKNLSWEIKDFCNEFCLSKYQKKIGSTCVNCHVDVEANCLGKYCVRILDDIRQFCSNVCLDEHKKGIKVCAYCQKYTFGSGERFFIRIGDKGQFVNFCSKGCLEGYDNITNNRQLPPKPGLTCSVCFIEGPIIIEVEHNSKLNYFCGESCFAAFKFANNITPGKCDMCRKYFDIKILEAYTIFFDGEQHSFCSKRCQNIHIIANRKIVQCSWCKVEKYNFDMIKRTFANGQIVTMCSVICLSLYQVSINAVHSNKVKCDNCLKNLQPLCHLTMSDGRIRNFCTYSCVMTFQNQFCNSPITLSEADDVSLSGPIGAHNSSGRATRKISSQLLPYTKPTIPIIRNVQPLAITNGPSSSTKHLSHSTSAIANTNAPLPTLTTGQKQIMRQIIIRPRPFPVQRNVATMCQVVCHSKGINCKPTVTHKEVQTDEIKDKVVVIPIPVPIYVPCPMHMYSIPIPIPVPFPLPIPVPIFIPTTRNSANGIMKEIKKIQVKIPTDPLEAQLLVMAEMVAGSTNEGNTNSESEEEDKKEGFSSEAVDASNILGDNMLPMDMIISTELDKPTVDIERALNGSFITVPEGADNAGYEESVDDPQSIESMRGCKRTVKQTKQHIGSKRARRMSHGVGIPIMEPPQPPEPVEKPDANMSLKYTFAVNAWKRWATTKNAELEKSAHRDKLFKPEMLQLNSDELNYSLCLFVRQLRKPNGQEYSPDVIYYLCLGIQQYVFENGRFDNIFYDSNYEKFTDCLDEIARKFPVFYNDSRDIVTCVEEEHLWESKQLGAHSPQVLLSTLMFFNTKYFHLTTIDEHMQLPFSHIMKHWKRCPNQPGISKVPGSKNVLLRFYPPQTELESNTRKEKVYEQHENTENPLRCPVRLYEFYLSKCPESVKTRNDIFYLQPERSCLPDSPVWYSTMPSPRETLEKMLHRLKMIKEINIFLLTN